MEKPEQQFQLKWKAIAICMIMVCASVLGTAYAMGTGTGGNSIPVVIESGSGVETASYIIYKDGDYSCIKNGTTGRIMERSENLTTALNSILIDDVGSVYFAYGDYELYHVDVQNGTSLMGDGATITIMDGGYIENSTLSIHGSDVTISGLNFVGVDMQNKQVIVADGDLHDLVFRDLSFQKTGTAIEFKNASNVLIDNCRAYDLTGYGFVSRNAYTPRNITIINCLVSNSTLTGYTINPGIDVYIENCIGTGSNAGTIDVSHGSENVFISNFHCYDAVRFLNDEIASPQTKNVVITNCIVERTTATGGAVFWRGDNLTISNSQFYDCNVFVINQQAAGSIFLSNVQMFGEDNYISTYSSTSYLEYSGGYVEFTGNASTNCQTSIEVRCPSKIIGVEFVNARTAISLYAAGASKSSVTGCTFRSSCDPSRAAVRIATGGAAVTNVMISGNLFVNSAYYDVWLDTGAGGSITNCSIVNNHFNRSSASISVKEAGGTCNYNTIQFNKFVLGTVSKAGTSTVVRYNDGYVTERWGVATILNGQQEVVITHGLSGTPTMVVCSGTMGATSAVYVLSVTLTQITLKVGSAVGMNSPIYWYAAI